MIVLEKKPDEYAKSLDHFKPLKHKYIRNG